MSDIAVSVIIPVYNRIDYCKTALDTLKSQSLANIEFVIIDDGSTDGTFEYLNQRVGTDKRFKIYKLNQNSGPSAARNFALTKASGEYIGFFDIDDNITPDYFQGLYKHAVDNDAEIVFGTYNNLLHKKTGLISKLDDKIESLYNGALWDKLFKKDLILQNDISFPNGLYCADNIFVFLAFYYAKSVYVCNDVVYSYTLNSDSISIDSGKSEKRKQDILKILNLIADFISAHGFNAQAREQTYYFLNRTFNSYNQDRKFTKLRDSILLKIRQKGIYYNKQSRVRIKKNMMIWLKIKRHLGLISRQKFDDQVCRLSLKKSGLFDKKWYLKMYPDVAAAHVNPIKHYLKHGWREGRNPSPKFDTNAYLMDNPDVVCAGVCPLLHYIKFGYNEGRFIRSVQGAVCPTHKNKLKYILTYPIRVHDEYHRLKDEIRNLKKVK